MDAGAKKLLMTIDEVGPMAWAKGILSMREATTVSTRVMVQCLSRENMSPSCRKHSYQINVLHLHVTILYNRRAIPNCFILYNIIMKQGTLSSILDVPQSGL